MRQVIGESPRGVDKSCEVCSIINGPLGELDVQIITAQDWRVSLMNDQGSLGASYLTTKDHVSTVGEISPAQWQELGELVRLLERAIDSAFAPEYFNLAADMNDAALGGQSPHVHFKHRPRYKHAVTVGGEEFSDPGYGTKTIQRHKVGRETLLVIRDVIQTHLA